MKSYIPEKKLSTLIALCCIKAHNLHDLKTFAACVPFDAL